MGRPKKLREQKIWIPLSEKFCSEPNKGWRVTVSIGKFKYSDTVLLCLSKERRNFNGDWFTGGKSFFVSTFYWQALFLPPKRLLFMAMNDYFAKRDEA